MTHCHMAKHMVLVSTSMLRQNSAARIGILDPLFEFANGSNEPRFRALRFGIKVGEGRFPAGVQQQELLGG